MQYKNVTLLEMSRFVNFQSVFHVGFGSTHLTAQAKLDMHTRNLVDPNLIHLLTIVCNRLIRLCRLYNRIL